MPTLVRQGLPNHNEHAWATQSGSDLVRKLEQDVVVPVRERNGNLLGKTLTNCHSPWPLCPAQHFDSIQVGGFELPVRLGNFGKSESEVKSS